MRCIFKSFKQELQSLTSLGIFTFVVEYLWQNILGIIEEAEVLVTLSKNSIVRYNL